MQVLKFGGSSVANAANIKRVRKIVQQKSGRGKTLVIVSAFGGITDLLLKCTQLAATGDASFRDLLKEAETRHIEAVKELMPLQNQSGLLSKVMQQFNEVEDILNGVFLLGECSPRTRDRIMSYGELLSSRIISSYFNADSLENVWSDSREWIRTDDHFNKAAVDFEETAKLASRHFNGNGHSLFVAPGFIASSSEGHTTTLGRGGSDYTAAIAGACMDAERVEIWTDVSGMMTADPRLVSNARQIPSISYHEAMELSHFGAKVIYPPTLQPLMSRNIPVHIKNTFADEDAGTLIEGNTAHGNSIRGISSIGAVALLSLEGSGMIGIPGFSRRLFQTLAAHRVNVILITQASSEHSICVGVDEANALLAKEAVDKAFSLEISKGELNPLNVETGMSIVALVGEQMKNHPGISGRMFGVLGRNGINVRAIAQGSSERNISAVVAGKDTRKALNVLHEEFFETTYKQVNLFIAGTGNVGGKLLAQIAQQQQYLQQLLNLQIRVTGISNSRKMIFSNEGIDLRNWHEQLDQGEASNVDSFVQRMLDKNLRNAVFVDVTANDRVAAAYETIFPASISVVACNKIACSSPYSVYRKLKDQARDFNASFLFETNVGASLPIIGTLNDLLRSGDRVTSIEAVLSGTLNYVFNHYKGEIPFSQIVRQAQEEGYTEPDPRLDLSGIDVMRKIMILAREAGESLEMEAIENNSFMPPSCMTGTVDDFYREMTSQEDHFKKLYQDAHAEGKKLKFVASYANGKASVGLKAVDDQHDFYRLYGKDNIVLFYTERYVDQPMVIKGAGAGAEVTASGVFADIIRAARI